MDTGVIGLTLALFCGGVVLLAARLLWWRLVFRRVNRQIAEYERGLGRQVRDLDYLRGVLAEMEAAERLLRQARDFDDVAPWQ